MATDKNLLLGVFQYFESGAAQHGLGAGAIGYPPVGGIGGITFLDEIGLRESLLLENVCFPKGVILRQRLDLFAASLHRLKNE